MAGQTSLRAQRLRNRVAVVTGGANGIGLGCALRLAEEGAAVAVIDLEQDALDAARDSFMGFDRAPLLVAADCTKRQDVEAFLSRVERDLGPIDVLVNNVGQGARERKAAFLESEEDVWRFVVEINLFTTMRFSRLVAPGMAERGWGRIINMASESAVIGPVGSHDYSAAKMAIIGFTRAIARELAPRGVTANALCPGPVRTRALERSAGDEAKKAVASIPVGFLGEPEDIAAMTALLASDEGRYITGQSILVNGGRWWL